MERFDTNGIFLAFGTSDASALVRRSETKRNGLRSSSFCFRSARTVMEGFFSPVPKAGGGGGGGGAEAPPLWVQIKQEKAECLVALSELSAGAFKAKHGSNLGALKGLNPVKGFINKDAGAVCTSKGNIFLVAPWPANKRSSVWEKLGDISGSAGTPSLVVCLEGGCYQEVRNQHPR